MTTDMTASGWECQAATDGSGAAVQVLRSWRIGGAHGGLRQALVQLNMSATNFGGGGDTYPSTGIPLPNPSLIGFRQNISYVIPCGPFFRRKQGIIACPPVMWAAMVPSGGVSGTTPVNTGYIRVIDPRVDTVSGGATQLKEPVTTIAASTLFTTDCYTAFAVFGGN